MTDETFAFSGQPTYLEAYQCYDDLSRTDWGDGLELRQNRDTWDERTREKWRFFYRPFPAAVGRPQRKMLQQRSAAIFTCKKYLEQAKKLQKEAEASLREQVAGLIIALSILGLLTVIALAQTSAIAALWILGIVVVVARHDMKKHLARRRIGELPAKMIAYVDAIQQSESESKILEDEIQQLQRQIPLTVSAAKIDEWLAEELVDLEYLTLSELTGRAIDRDNISSFLRQNFGDPRVHGLLIDSWGVLQRMWQDGPFGRESTGLGKAKEELKKRIGTWQIGSSYRPVFRLLFLQYIFPHSCPRSDEVKRLQ